MQTHTGRTPYEKEAEIVVIQLQVKGHRECQQPPGEARRESQDKFLCEPPEETKLAGTPDTSSLQICERKHFLLLFQAS